MIVINILSPMDKIMILIFVSVILIGLIIGTIMRIKLELFNKYCSKGDLKKAEKKGAFLKGMIFPILTRDVYLIQLALIYAEEEKEDDFFKTLDLIQTKKTLALKWFYKTVYHLRRKNIQYAEQSYKVFLAQPRTLPKKYGTFEHYQKILEYLICKAKKEELPPKPKYNTKNRIITNLFEEN